MKDIESAMARGASYRDIALQFQVGVMSLRRHAEHIAQILESKRNEMVSDRATSLIDQLEEQRQIVERVQQAQITTELNILNNSELILKCADRRHKQIELEARLRGEFKSDQPPVTEAERLARINELLDKARGRRRLAE